MNGSDPNGRSSLSADELQHPPTPEEIAKALQHAADTFTDIVEPSDATPPGDQSWNLFIGNEVHKAIERRFADLNEGNDVYFDTRLDTILENTALHGNPNRLKPGTEADRPDILDTTYGRLYEIKPDNDAVGAVTQLNRYLRELHDAGATDVHAGEVDVPGTSEGVVSAPGGYQDIVTSSGAVERLKGGYAIYASPAPGVILYDKHNGRFTPRTASDTSCSLNQALNLAAAVTKAIIETLVIVVGIGLEGGGGRAPALV